MVDTKSPFRLWNRFGLLLVISTPVWSQLSPNCTVSVLNRNAQVRQDGTWVLANVPINQGRVRARAVCRDTGVTRLGESDLFSIPLNGSVNIVPIRLGAVSSIPDGITLSATQTSLSSVGATSQLASIARYPGGSTADVTQFAKGTNYVSSNDAVATVSADGLVRAVANGYVVITTFNEGTSGFINIRVGIPPTISITAPVSGTTIVQGATFPVTLQITGGPISSVSLSMNGQSVGTTTTPPYQFGVTAPVGVSAIQLVATVRGHRFCAQ